VQVWHLDESCGRTGATGLKWIEDTNWTLSLDAGWNLDVVSPLPLSLVLAVLGSCFCLPGRGLQAAGLGRKLPLHGAVAPCRVSTAQPARKRFALAGSLKGIERPAQ
jgi:hypothetical protein